MNVHTRLGYLWLLFLCFPVSFAATENAERLDPQVRTEIDYLLSRVQASGYVFIRNGKEHNGTDAAEHMQRKFEHFLDNGDIETVDDFIDRAGTRSLITGREYLVRLPDDTEIPTAQWLRAEIAARRTTAAEVSR